MALRLNDYPALVLNADFTPKTIFPLSTLSWREVAKGLFLDKYVRVVDYDARIITRTQTYVFPSVVAMKEYLPVQMKVPFNRHNIYLRDRGRCAYCLKPLDLSEFTFDHVTPQALGGQTTWENIVVACQPCNGAKAAKSLKAARLVLHTVPREPTVWEIAAKARELGRLGPTPKEWHDFLYWETTLEK